MSQTSLIAVRQEWQEAWGIRRFRTLVMAGFLITVAILSFFPSFFQRIEQRRGIVLNDPLLRLIPAHNVSIPLFIIIWTLSALAAVRCVQSPRMFLTFVWSFIVLSLFRMLTIFLVPLDPPAGLIGLIDPLSNFFYGPKFVTKDLFFSGHTSTIFLLYFCLPGRVDKRLALLITFGVALLLLIQHVHYTLDVLGGFLFGWLSWWITTKTILREPANPQS
ncbi:MAG TPA: phosphatase PAP2 family protein [Puia sp.]|nr:phosphatase PAP2 family protein [Puia sp.]